MDDMNAPVIEVRGDIWCPFGSPRFFFGDKDAFCPSPDITKGLDHDLAIIRDTFRPTEFLEQCSADDAKVEKENGGSP